MEETDFKYLAKYRVRPIANKLFTLGLAQILFAPMRKRQSLDLFKPKDTACRDIPVHQREPCLLALLKIAPEDVCIATFMDEIELMCN